MRQYELMIILDPALDPSDTKKITTIIHKLAGEYAGMIQDLNVIGKKSLAYIMNKHTEGIYCLVKIEAESVEIGKLQKQAKLMTEIVRFLLTVKA